MKKENDTDNKCQCLFCKAHRYAKKTGDWTPMAVYLETYIHETKQNMAAIMEATGKKPTRIADKRSKIGNLLACMKCNLEEAESLFAEIDFNKVKTKEPLKTYIRYGELPPDGKSKIYSRTGKIIGEEKGVSVFEYLVGRGIVVPDNQNAKDDFLKLSNSCWQRAYLVSGDEVGIGSDGEPLLANIKVMKEIRNANVR